MRTRVVFAFFCSAAWLAAAEPEQLYLDVVKPALEQQCLGCHGVGNTFGDEDAFAQLIDEVETKLFGTLPDDTWFYPGHGNDSTLGAERPHLAEWRERGW